MVRGRVGGSEMPGSERDVLLLPWIKVQNKGGELTDENIECTGTENTQISIHINGE